MGPLEIADQLAHDIRTAAYPPGSRLVQSDIAARFQVSRIPVREALQTLVAQGLVTYLPGGGATVREMSSREIRELYELRLLIEPALSTRMLGGATSRSITRLQTLADQMDSDVDIAEWQALNFDFHVETYSLIERPYTETILRQLLAAVQPYSVENIATLGGREQAVREHHLMVDALRQQDAETLAHLLRHHLESAMERVALAHDGRIAQPQASER